MNLIDIKVIICSTFQSAHLHVGQTWNLCGTCNLCAQPHSILGYRDTLFMWHLWQQPHSILGCRDTLFMWHLWYQPHSILGCWDTLFMCHLSHQPHSIFGCRDTLLFHCITRCLKH